MNFAEWTLSMNWFIFVKFWEIFQLFGQKLFKMLLLALRVFHKIFRPRTQAISFRCQSQMHAIFSAEPDNREKTLKSTVLYKDFFFRWFCMKFHYIEVIYACARTWFSFKKHWKLFSYLFSKQQFCRVKLKSQKLNCKSQTAQNIYKKWISRAKLL